MLENVGKIACMVYMAVIHSVPKNSPEQAVRSYRRTLGPKPTKENGKFIIYNFAILYDDLY